MTGSEMSTVSVNSLTRKHLVIHNSIKPHSIHTQHVMNIIHRDICANHYIVLHLMQAFFFTFNGNTLQRMYFNADLPWVFACKKMYPNMHAFTRTWRLYNLLPPCWVFMKRLQKIESDIKALGPAYTQQIESPL